MQIHVTDVPAKGAGEHISKVICEHDGDVVCLLSGGSALDVVEYIQIGNNGGQHHAYSSEQVLAQSNFAADASSTTHGAGLVISNAQRSECRTIFMMGDERVSGESDTNNFLQLQTRYPDSPVTACTIPTIPEVNESPEYFATRIEKIFLEKISTLRNVKIISILGLGADGHTAGIFPLPKESFQETYRDDSVYVPVHVEGLTIDSRASFTPTWLLDHVDAVIGYVAGEGKKMILESLIHESKLIHERPAEILKLHRDVNLYTDRSMIVPRD